ncbi:MAG: carbamoyltransferase HypF [Cyclobacteriaceae bacterium]
MVKTWKILIEGRVQGVGFRPFIHRVACELSLEGVVKNVSQGVEIRVNVTRPFLDRLIDKIRKDAPEIAIIRNISFSEIGNQFFESFQICKSEKSVNPTLELSPDFAICDNCKDDIVTADGPKYSYPFTTCSYCGPRYSIISGLPYDRNNTSMLDFEMCENCLSEYKTPQNRRFHSQTNSCERCGITMQLIRNTKTEGSTKSTEIIDELSKIIANGGVVAIKGLGGYLLCCDTRSSSGIKRLREIKKRPEKPFAIMCPNADFVKTEFDLKSSELEMLTSAVSPIMLLTPKNPKIWDMESLAPGLTKLGVMMPYTPFFHLLMELHDAPVIATSANITNSPIEYEDGKAVEHFHLLADGILTYNRTILMPQDDSVMFFTKNKNQSIVLRRSRGFAPSGIDLKFPGLKGKTLLAMGADLKGSFGYFNEGQIYLSQYFGDLVNFDTLQRYKAAIEHFITLFQKPPDIILADLHPGYHSSKTGLAIAKEIQSPIRYYQHHQAHFAAVLAEHKLLSNDERVLGVCWDGTGYGDDGIIWGGEFFLKENEHLSRVGHVGYFDHIAADKMPQEPRLSALSICRNNNEAEQILRLKFTEIEWGIYQKLLEKNTLKTSSVGRLFDGVASLLGLCDHSSYEGQAAMLLEESATKFAQDEGLDYHEHYNIILNEGGTINIKAMLSGLLIDQNKKTITEIAFKFHLTLVKCIEFIAKSHAVRSIAFSGGVFQNGLLTDLIIHRLEEHYKLYFHQKLSPNDENIALGQLALHSLSMQ